MASPKVTIALPVYNGQNYLKNALDSLLAQTYSDFEIILGDNASTDDTTNICRSYAAVDKRISYIRHETNIGAAANYNRLYELAKGTYFKWAAHDDICSPGFLKSCVDKLDHDPSVVLCSPRQIAIDSDGAVIEGYMDKYRELKHIGSPASYKRFHDLSCLNHGCYEVFGLIRYSELGRTPKIANYIGSDRVLLAELSLLGRFWASPEPIYFRRHNAQYCALDNDASRSEWFDPSTNESKSKTHHRNMVEYIRAIQRVRLSYRDKLLCYMVMLDWLKRKRHRLIKEYSTGKYANFQNKIESK